MEKEHLPCGASAGSFAVPPLCGIVLKSEKSIKREASQRLEWMSYTCSFSMWRKCTLNKGLLTSTEGKQLQDGAGRKV